MNVSKVFLSDDRVDGHEIVGGGAPLKGPVREDSQRPSLAKPLLDEIEQFEDARKTQMEIRFKALGILKNKFIMENFSFDRTLMFFEKDLYFPNLQGEVSFMTRKVYGADKIHGMLVDPKYKNTLKELNNSIAIYVDEMPFDPDFRPVKGQLCLVQAMKWREIEDLMKFELGRSWSNYRFPSGRNYEIDNKDAGKWFRAVCTDTIANFQWKFASSFLFTFVDTGRQMPIPLKNIRNIIFNYIHQPIMAPFFTIFLYNLEQYDERADNKLKEVFKKYRIVTVNVLSLVGESFVCQLVSPSEIEMDLEYAILQKEAPPKAEPHILGTPKENQILTLDPEMLDIQMKLFP